MKMLLLEANIDDERQTVIIRTREVNIKFDNKTKKMECRYKR